ncbi:MULTISPECIES: substrate-binding periplasmic protein [Rugamonas]|uniref:Solute-binding protein family 3/N-terminal domain-containing protein n=1 Tax=Rugamonas rubra TaxID=758825 RepID=A0A1I4NVK0_9BURK|nr:MULTISPECIES: transporter substrate-binding domain-containing protein [Rugamonas]WGG48526.1 transporter substrate-binding domain-containing protein [Rugamonas sp. DEMB1]SFM19574.1 conserved hypothetical protein [Rugamonas rubra]
MRYTAALATACLLGASCAVAAPTLTVAWRDKPPYYYLDHGVAKGFMLQRAKEVFALAGVPARFVQEPQKRIWINFAHGTPNYCSIAWYRLPEREAVAQFSQPLMTDPPQGVLIAPRALARVRTHATLASLLADPQLTLGVVDGVSYGPELDALIARSANQIMRRTVTTVNMMRMIAAGRADYMLVDREDWKYASAHAAELNAAVRRDYADAPPGLKRYLVCSRDVPAEVMNKLNQAIAATAERH